MRCGCRQIEAKACTNINNTNLSCSPEKAGPHPLSSGLPRNPLSTFPHCPAMAYWCAEQRCCIDRHPHTPAIRCGLSCVAG